jgi:hypothetical protein
MTKRVAHCVETLDVADVTKRIELKHEAHLPCGRSIRIASPIAPSIPAKVETIKIASTVMRISLRACALHQFANARMFRAPHDTFVSLCRAARGSAHPGAGPWKIHVYRAGRKKLRFVLAGRLALADVLVRFGSRVELEVVAATTASARLEVAVPVGPGRTRAAHGASTGPSVSCADTSVRGVVTLKVRRRGARKHRQHTER